jgi:putative transcriptional regulator
MSPERSTTDAAETHAIQVHLDRLLAQRNMTLTELSERVGVTIANLSILKNGRARAIRFSTLTRLCETLGCQPGDLLTYSANDHPEPAPPAGTHESPQPL